MVGGAGQAPRLRQVKGWEWGGVRQDSVIVVPHVGEYDSAIVVPRVGEDDCAIAVLRVGEDDCAIAVLRVGEDDCAIVVLRVGEHDCAIVVLRVGEYVLRSAAEGFFRSDQSARSGGWNLLGL